MLSPQQQSEFEKLYSVASPEDRAALDAAVTALASEVQQKPWAAYAGDPLGYIKNILHIDLTDKQTEIVKALISPPNRVHVDSGHSLGKAQNVDLVIDTPDGKRRWGDLRPGDLVFGVNGNPVTVLAIHPQGIKKQYKVTFNDHTSTLCCGEHLWTVQSRANRRVGRPHYHQWNTLSTEEIIKIGVKGRGGKVTLNRFMIPTYGPVVYQHRDVEIAPYTLGVWLGDGDGWHGNITSEDAEMPIFLREDGGMVWTRKTKDRATTVVVSMLKSKLRSIGLLGKKSFEKRVPIEYMENSADVRLAVLQGLMDTDGTCGKQGSVTFSSTSRGLIEDVAWLVRSLGGKASINPKAKKPFYYKGEEKVYCRDSWTVSIRLENLPIFRLKRKLERAKKSKKPINRFITDISEAGLAEMMCITVDAPDGLYLTNDFIVTHNTLLAACLVNYFYDSFPKCAIITTAPTYEHVSTRLWGEVRRLRREAKARFPDLPMDLSPRAPEMRSSEDHFAVGCTASKGEALHGLHMEYMLFIFDESEGLEQMYFTTTSSMFVPGGKHLWLSLDNPVTLSSPAYLETRKANGDGTPIWNLFRLTALEHPNVERGLAGLEPIIPGAVTAGQIDDWLVEYNCQQIEEREAQGCDFQWRGKWYHPGPMAESRILGLRPSQGTASVWTDSIWSAAEARDLSFPLNEMPEIGCDVARVAGGDDCDIHIRWGGVSIKHESANGRPIPQTAARLKELAVWACDFANKVRQEAFDRNPQGQFKPFFEHQIPIKVDDGSSGGAVIDLRGVFNFIPVSAASINQEEKYPNLRSELWFELAERARLGGFSLKYLLKTDRASVTKLKLQAMAPLWSMDARQRRVVEKKELTHKRLNSSPDAMDAMNLAYYHTGGSVASMIGKPLTDKYTETMGSKMGILGRRGGPDDEEAKFLRGDRDRKPIRTLGR